MSDHSDDLDKLLSEWRAEGLGGEYLGDPSAWIAINEVYQGLRAGGFTETQSLRIIAVLIAENGARHNDDKEQQ